MFQTMQLARYEKKHGSVAFWKVVESGGVKFWSDMSWNMWKKVMEFYISI